MKYFAISCHLNNIIILQSQYHEYLFHNAKYYKRNEWVVINVSFSSLFAYSVQINISSHAVADYNYYYYKYYNFMNNYES